MIDAAGVAIIVIGAFGAVLQYLLGLRGAADRELAYRTLRKNLGRAILLGLEVLIAGDIIKSVAITPKFTSVGTLAIIVTIRTVLSVELELEIDGR